MLLPSVRAELLPLASVLELPEVRDERDRPESPHFFLGAAVLVLAASGGEAGTPVDGPDMSMVGRKELCCLADSGLSTWRRRVWRMVHRRCSTDNAGSVHDELAVRRNRRR